MVNAPPNGPPCTVCGYPLRWFGDQNAWGCDRCQRMFPAAPPQHQQMQHARPKSKLGLWLAIGGVAVAGGVVAIVLAMKGGGGGGASDPKSVVTQALGAMSSGDVDALIKLTGIENMYSTAVKCDDTASDNDKDVTKMLDKARRDYTRRVEKLKGLKLELASMPDLDKRDQSADMVMKKGDKMSKGCVTNMEVHMVETKIDVSVKDGDKPASTQTTKIGLISVDGKWYMLELPDIEKGGNFDAQLAKMSEFRDKLCACSDSACGDAAFKEMQTWTEANMRDLDKAKPSAEDMKKAAAITDDMAKCMSKLTQGGAPAVNATAPPPAEIATGGGGGDLPKECDEWRAAIDKLGSCAKYPKASVDAMKKAFDQASEMWKKLPADSRAQLSTTCASAAKSVADGAKALGCN